MTRQITGRTQEENSDTPARAVCVSTLERPATFMEGLSMATAMENWEILASLVRYDPTGNIPDKWGKESNGTQVCKVCGKALRTLPGIWRHVEASHRDEIRSLEIGEDGLADYLVQIQEESAKELAEYRAKYPGD